MTSENNIKSNSDRKDKYQKIIYLSECLTELLTIQNRLINDSIPILEALHVHKTGINTLALMNAHHTYLRLKRKKELVQSRVNKNEKISEELIESQLDDEYIIWDEKISDYIQKIKFSDNILITRLKPEDSSEISRIYKKLVKILHPDINPQQTEPIQNLWSQLKFDYSNTSLLLLKEIEKLANSVILVNNYENKSNEFLDERITFLSQQIDKQNQKIAELMSNYPLNIESKINDWKWIEHENQKMLIEKERYLLKIDKLEIYVNKLKDIYNDE